MLLHNKIKNIMSEFDPIEKFIQENKSKNFVETCFSPKFIEKQKKAWNTIVSSEEPQLCYFAYSGYTTSFYYRSKSKNIYLVEAYLGDLYDYLLLE